MWLSPLIGEVLHPQQNNTLVLGGAGFSDILFSPGFSVLIASSFYCGIILVIEKLNSN
jgi:hypothetical protein